MMCMYVYMYVCMCVFVRRHRSLGVRRLPYIFAVRVIENAQESVRRTVTFRPPQNSIRMTSAKSLMHFAGELLERREGDRVSGRVHIIKSRHRLKLFVKAAREQEKVMAVLLSKRSKPHVLFRYSTMSL